MMRAAFLTGHGGNEVVRVGERPVPDVPPGHALVAMRAATLNRVDLYMRDSGAGITHRLPQVMGVDGAGVIAACGEGVADWTVGQPVTLYPAIGCETCEYCQRGDTMLCVSVRFLGEHRDGTFADYVSVPAANLFALPDGIDFAQGAALGVAWLTAWRMLVTQAQLREGETVLIFGIGGGVSDAAMHLALAMGARVLVTSRNPARREAAMAAGARAAFATDAEVAGQAMDATAGRGVDVVIDNIGQAVWPSALKSLARGGRLVTCGATSGDAPSADIRRLFVRQLHVIGSTLGTRAEFADLIDFVDRGTIRPGIARTFGLDTIHAALDLLSSGQNQGKLAIALAGHT